MEATIGNDAPVVEGSPTIEVLQVKESKFRVTPPAEWNVVHRRCVESRFVGLHDADQAVSVAARLFEIRVIARENVAALLCESRVASAFGDFRPHPCEQWRLNRCRLPRL